MEEFTYLILGDEPAGLWLARQLAKEFQDADVVPRIGWISLTENPPPVCLPVSPAEAFGIPVEDGWSAEIVTPRGSLVWDDASIEKKFPEIKGGNVRNVLRKSPELLSWASALWRFVGRTGSLHPENLVAGALTCTKLRWWSPADEMPDTVERISLSLKDNPIEAVQPRRPGGFSLSFKGKHPFLAQKWILNLDLRRLETLCGDQTGLWDLINTDASVLDHHALYPLRLRTTDRGLPTSLRPLTVLLDSEEIPDVASEVWPAEIRHLEKEKAMTLWVSSPRDLSLDSALDHFRQGLQRLNRLFPFLAREMLYVHPPLSMDTCFTPTQREETLGELERESIELYRLTTPLTQTRSSALHVLFPFLNCHLPYPLGTLHAAQGLLREAVRKKKKKPEDKPSAPAVSPTTS